MLEVRRRVGYWLALDEQMITNGGWAPAHQPHWCNTYQDIIGTVGAPDQDTIIAQNINLKYSCPAIIFSAQKKSLPAIKRST